MNQTRKMFTFKKYQSFSYSVARFVLSNEGVFLITKCGQKFSPRNKNKSLDVSSSKINKMLEFVYKIWFELSVCMYSQV